MVKAKFGDRIRNKNPVAQENELLCKFIVHNIVVLIHESFELGVKIDFASIILLRLTEVASLLEEIHMDLKELKRSRA